MIKKRGQMKISFGMIFSLILIIVFMAAAFFAIKALLNIKDSAIIGKFGEALDRDISKALNSHEASVEKEYSLPSSVEYVCIIDYSKSESQNIPPPIKGVYKKLEQFNYGTENFFIYPGSAGGELTGKKLEKINLKNITRSNNPFCIKNKNGKLTLTLKKSPGENLVTITK